MVDVFPVPGGPKIMYGAGLAVPFTIFWIAFFCSGLPLMAELNHVKSSVILQRRN